MTEMIQQSPMSIAMQTKKQKKPEISSPTRALMKKRREMIENNTPRDHIEYVDIWNTVKKKVREDIRKHNLDEIRETIKASKSLNKVRRTHSLGKKRMITILDKQGNEIQEQDLFIYLFIYLFIKTYLYRVVHNQTILILFYSVALFLTKSKSRDN